MLTTVRAGRYTVRGVSVGGVYTSLHVPELGVLLDIGLAPRSFAGVDQLLISHGHADHIGALNTLLGIRGLMRRGPLKIFMPSEIVDDVCAAVAATSRLQRWDLAIEPVGMQPGDEQPLRDRLWLRAFRTLHTVPSLGYSFVQRVDKLRPEFTDLPGPEIARRRKLGEDLLYVDERHELAYVTDTLVTVLERQPELLDVRVLVLECSFLDDRKDRAASRAGCHVHLDELVDWAPRLRNEQLVLMHFSQIYKPREVREILRDRLPVELMERVRVFAPGRADWPG